MYIFHGSFKTPDTSLLAHVALAGYFVYYCKKVSDYWPVRSFVRGCFCALLLCLFYGTFVYIPCIKALINMKSDYRNNGTHAACPSGCKANPYADNLRCRECSSEISLEDIHFTTTIGQNAVEVFGFACTNVVVRVAIVFWKLDVTGRVCQY